MLLTGSPHAFRIAAGLCKRLHQVLLRGSQNTLQAKDRISRSLLARGLDTNTTFEIVSIDIADIDVGNNIGARLQSDQAEADTRTARARAEARRAKAIAYHECST